MKNFETGHSSKTEGKMTKDKVKRSDNKRLLKLSKDILITERVGTAPL